MITGHLTSYAYLLMAASPVLECGAAGTLFTSSHSYSPAKLKNQVPPLVSHVFFPRWFNYITSALVISSIAAKNYQIQQ